MDIAKTRQPVWLAKTLDFARDRLFARTERSVQGRNEMRRYKTLFLRQKVSDFLIQKFLIFRVGAGAGRVSPE